MAAEKEQQQHQQMNLLDGCAIQVKGLLTEVSFYENPNTRKVTHSMHLVTPGSSPLKIAIKSGVDPLTYRGRVGQVVAVKINVRESKFGTFFDEA